MWLAVGPPSLRGYGGLSAASSSVASRRAVLGGAAPSSRALGSLGLLGPVAAARCLGEIKLFNGHIDRRIGWASTPGGTPKELFEAWRPLLANYRKPAPAFVKQRLKFLANARLTTHLNNSHEPSDSEPVFVPPRVEHDSNHRGKRCPTGFCFPWAAFP